MSIGRFILCRSTERSGAYTSVLQFLIDNSNSLTKGKMFALQKTIGNARLARQIVQQRRTVVDLPPNVKVTFIEKLLGGIALTASILGPATYISYNIKNYNMK